MGRGVEAGEGRVGRSEEERGDEDEDASAVAR